MVGAGAFSNCWSFLWDKEWVFDSTPSPRFVCFLQCVVRTFRTCISSISNYIRGLIGWGGTRRLIPTSIVLDFFSLYAVALSSSCRIVIAAYRSLSAQFFPAKDVTAQHTARRQPLTKTRKVVELEIRRHWWYVFLSCIVLGGTC